MAVTKTLSEQKARSIARKAVVAYWNDNKSLVKKFGKISYQKVYVVWQCKALQNWKALLGVNFDGDGYYFEFTWNGDAKVGYLDVYRKSASITVTA